MIAEWCKEDPPLTEDLLSTAVAVTGKGNVVVIFLSAALLHCDEEEVKAGILHV